ncbi:MAG: hypothetical protein EPO12_08250 [Aquabacterium sp.]|nr:MAG: hypothetical protein EPO12_08250 [Aquabacterium sp.]
MTRTLPALTLATLAAFVVPAAQAKPAADPFADKPLAADGLHVEAANQFKPWQGGDVPLGSYESGSHFRNRLGTVALSPRTSVHLDAIRNVQGIPSHFELVDARGGAVLLKLAVFNVEDASWFFSASGVLYLNQAHLGLCGARVTRKFVVEAGKVVETRQPLLAIDTETTVREAAPLFDAPAGKGAVATVAAGSKVLVIGVQPGGDDPRRAALLVKTPFGLTGWHRRDIAAGVLDIDRCN